MNLISPLDRLENRPMLGFAAIFIKNPHDMAGSPAGFHFEKSGAFGSHRVSYTQISLHP